MLFRKSKKPRYPKRPPLPIIRRRLPMRYHMKHQFGVHDVAFVQTMHAISGAPMSTGNHVEILKNGVQIFPSMLAAIRGAKKNINIEFYIYWDGEIGRLFAETLAERARAGVAVKVILDSVGSATMSRSLIDFMQRNGIDLEWYHPAFMDNWVKSRGELLTGLDYFPAVPPRGEHLAQVIKSSPSEGSSTVKLLYIVSMVSAQQRIWISSAYFVPDKDTIRALEGAVRRGVDVRVIIPGEIIDVPIVRQAGRLHYNELLDRGIRLWEYQPTMMHAKTMVVDGIWSTVGSSNFDDRSFRLNDEVNVNIYDEAIAAQMEAMFQEDLARGEEIKLRPWMRRPRFARVKEWVAGRFRPQL